MSAQSFVDQIESLSSKKLQQIRRAAGTELGENQDTTALFYQILPGEVTKDQEEAYFYASILCATSKTGQEGSGGFGTCLGKADPEGQFADYLANVLDIEELKLLSSQLARGIRYLNAKKAPLDRVRLVDDIVAWKSANRLIQRDWARDYCREISLPKLKTDDPVRGFFSLIRRLKEAQKEAFRTSPNGRLEESPGTVLIAFYSALPEKIDPLDERLYYQVATLSLINEESHAPCKDIGASLNSVCTEENEDYLENIVTDLVEGELDEIYPVLVRAVIFLRNLRVGFCPEQLLNDLLFWKHPGRSVQTAWKQSYYG